MLILRNNQRWKTVEKEGLTLKPELIVDYSKPYFDGVHITSTDLKSTNCSGKINVVAPKNLLNWTRNAATDFHCADVFCSKWWNSEEMTPTKSGDSADDV